MSVSARQLRRFYSDASLLAPIEAPEQTELQELQVGLIDLMEKSRTKDAEIQRSFLDFACVLIAKEAARRWP